MAAAIGDESRPSDAGRDCWFKNPLFWIVVLAIALRAAAVIATVGWEQPPSDKTIRYDAIALNLLEGNGFSRQGDNPTAVTPPLYPLLLAGVYGIVGYSGTAVRATLAILDVVTCVLWMLIASEIFDRRTGWTTALLIAICPYFVYMAVTAGSDTLFFLMLAVFLLTLVRTLGSPTRRGFALAGVALGLATLTRAVPLLLPVYLLPFLLLRYRTAPKRGAVATAFITVGFIAALTPWTVRNFVHFHRLIPVQTLGGYHLFLATVDRNDPEPRAIQPGSRSRGTVENDANLYARSWQRIADDPIRFLRGMAKRLGKMWYVTHSGRFGVFLGVVNLLLLVVAVVGAVMARGHWRELLPIYAVISYFVLLHSVLFAIFRYMMPVIPALLMLASIPLVKLVTRISPTLEEGR